MRLKIVNFQSIADSAIDIEGFTVVTGRSNLGKSALLRAARAAFFGLPGDYYVRDGATHAGVAIVDPDYKLIWRKVPKPTVQRQTALQVNDTTHTKLGKEHGVLTEVLGVRELVTSTKLSITPQFAMQHDPVFLLTETETNVAEVFRLLGRTDIVTAAQAAAKKDRTGAEGLLKVRNPDRDEAKRKKEELEHVPDLRKKVDALRTVVSRAEIKALQAQKLVAQLKELDTLQIFTIPDAPEIQITSKAAVITSLVRLQTLNPITYPEIAEVTIPDGRQRAVIAKLRQLEALSGDVAFLQRELEATQVQESQMEARRLELEAELGICPTCNRTFDHAH